MFMAAGCGAYTYAMFHVVTHAFFKALLFMSAGAVIVAMHHEQDMRNMGGLRTKLPRTHGVVVVGVATIAGFPMLSGFFSKDQILTSLFLAHGLPGHYFLYGIALFTAGLTAFYMCRLLFMTFYGEKRVAAAIWPQLRDPSSWIMWPLYVLAVLSIAGGIFGVPQFWGDMLNMEHSDSLANFLSSAVVTAEHHEITRATEWRLIGAAVGMSSAGLAVAYTLYIAKPALPDKITTALGALYRASLNKFYVDEIYDAVIVRPLVAVSDKVLYRGVDAGLIDGALVNGTASTVRALAAGGLKYVHSGFTQLYFLTMVVGALAILVYLLR
jgi:NADH-quinone oxidoreductase subunit L